MPNTNTDETPDSFSEIWWTPPGDGVAESVAFKVVGGPKRYLRLWLGSDPPSTDWGWRIHETAVQLWRDPDADRGLCDCDGVVDDDGDAVHTEQCARTVHFRGLGQR